MSRASRSRMVTLLASIFVMSCSNSTDPATITPRNPSVVVEYFGGMTPDNRRTFVVDSASGTWFRINCDPNISASPCLHGTRAATGVVSAESKQALFAAIRASAFLALPQTIPGGVGPEADGVHITLLVTVSGTPHLVQWNSGAPIPVALQNVMTAFSAATN